MLGTGLLLVLLALSLGPSPPFPAFSNADSGGSSREEEEKEDPHPGPPHHGDPHHWSYTGEDPAPYGPVGFPNPPPPLTPLNLSVPSSYRQGQLELRLPFLWGHLQSPIDIETSAAIFSPQLTPILLSGYDLPSEMQLQLKNNGHTIVLDLPRNLSVSRWGLPFPVPAAQLHLHWGSQPGLGGSEHTVDGHRFAGELHVVHYDSRFGSIKEAAKEPGGLAVLAAFLEVGSEENAPYQHILEHLGAIQEEGEETLVGGFDVAQLLPADLGRYFRYNGSLTTPPCFQTVNWTIFNQTLRLSPQQISVLEDTLRGDGDHPLHGNFRLPQDLYGRTVLASFSEGHSARRDPTACSPETPEKPPEEEGDGAASGQDGEQTHSPPEDASGGDPGPAPPEDGGSAHEETPGEEEGHGMAPGEDGGQPRSPPEGTSGADPVPAPPEGGSNRASGSGTAQQTDSGIQAGGVLAILFGVLFGLTALAFFLYVRKHRKQRLAAQSGKPSVIYTPAAKTEENTV